MKKFTVLGLFALLVMVFSATAYAQIEFKASGMIATGFIWERNVTDGVPGAVVTPFGGQPFAANLPPNGTNAADSGMWNRPQSFSESYGSLRFDFATGKEITGTFLFEMINARSGMAFDGPVVTRAPEQASFDTGIWGFKGPEFRIVNYYIDFAVPYFGIPAPMNIRAGVQTFGIRPTFFISTPGFGITYTVKADPASFAFMWGKMADPKEAASNDSTMYAGDLKANFGNISVGTFLVYDKMKQYPVTDLQIPYGVSPDMKADIFWWGLYSDGKAGPVNYNFDFIYDFGKVKAYDNSPLAGNPDVKYRGWVGQVKFNVPMEKFTFGGLGLYSSGADLRKTGEMGFPGEAALNGGAPATKVGTFMNPPSSEGFVPWAESLFLGGDFSTLIGIPLGYIPDFTFGSQLHRGSFGGTWIAKLFASYQTTPSFKTTLQGLYIGDTTKHGNTLGNAVDADGNPRNDNTIGWEFDLINNIMIYKNLHLTVEGGLLFAGKALEQNVPGTFENAKPRTPYCVATTLVYFF
jgi:hypothetical protein